MSESALSSLFLPRGRRALGDRDSSFVWKPFGVMLKECPVRASTWAFCPMNFTSSWSPGPTSADRRSMTSRPGPSRTTGRSMCRSPTQRSTCLRLGSATSAMVQEFARTARKRIRIGGGGYRRDHLRALAQRVEVADKEIRIMGSKSDLLRKPRSCGGPMVRIPLPRPFQNRAANAGRSPLCAPLRPFRRSSLPQERPRVRIRLPPPAVSGNTGFPRRPAVVTD